VFAFGGRALFGLFGALFTDDLALFALAAAFR